MKDVRAPRFIEPLQPQVIAEGECAILEARVDSFPTCSFQWFLHSVPVKVCFHTIAVTLFGNQSVHVTMRQQDDPATSVYLPVRGQTITVIYAHTSLRP